MTSSPAERAERAGTAPDVHPTALVDPSARLGAGVIIGPFCRVGAEVTLGAGTTLHSHVVVEGPTTLGARNQLFPFAALGLAPQDRSHRGEPTRLVAGDDCVFREQVTVHRGTVKGGGVTRVGARALLMVGAHVAHDAALGDDVTLINLATLGGHVVVEDRAVLGGQVAIAPFARVGRAAFVAGGARVERDVPPFVIAQGDRARVRALNRVGLERMGAEPASVAALERAFRLLWGRGATFDAGRAEARRTLGADPLVAALLDFLDDGVRAGRR